VLPYLRDLCLPEEDAVTWKAVSRRSAERPDVLRIGVADVPCISNFTDLDRLRAEGDVELVRISGAEDRLLDALILPGTKNTPQALRYLQNGRIDRLARRILAEGGTVLGLCGGYQLLGKRILDPYQIESNDKELKWLELLDVETIFGREKITVQVTGIHRASGSPIEGYEVHMGRTIRDRGVQPLFDIQTSAKAEVRTEGAVSGNGRVMGTYVHGIFESSAFRRHFLNCLRRARGWRPIGPLAHTSLDQELDRWAAYVECHLNVPAIETIISEGKPSRIS